MEKKCTGDEFIGSLASTNCCPAVHILYFCVIHLLVLALQSIIKIELELIVRSV